MKNLTVEKARKKALKLMAELEGEGMFTLMELKLLLEREIQNRINETERKPTETAASASISQ